MTSQASLSRQTKVRKTNPWAHSFWQGMRESLVFSILSALVYLAAIFGSFLMIKSSYDNAFNIDGTRFSTVYQYFFYDGSVFTYTLPIAIFVQAVTQGILTFRFLFKGNAVNVWFGVGISRRALFSSRLLAGALQALLPIALSLLVMLGINLAIFQNVGLILVRFLALLLGLGAEVLVVYAITAAVCSCVGSWVEGAAFSAIAAASPTAVLFSLNELMKRFLAGNCFGVNSYADIQPRQTLYNALASFNPLMFFYQNSAVISTSYRQPIAPQTSSAVPSLCWLAAALAIAYLAWRLFQARKVEIAGSMGRQRKLAYGCVFVVALFFFSLPLAYQSMTQARMSAQAVIILASLLFLAVGLLMVLPLRLIARPRWRSLLLLPTGLAAVFVLIGALYAGGVGYSGYVPNVNSVKSIAISYKGIPSLAPKSMVYQDNLIGTGEFEGSILLTDPNDFATAISIHRALVSAGHLAFGLTGGNPEKLVLPTDIHITYAMKNGAMVARDYNRADMAMLKAMMSLDNTDGVKLTFNNIVNGIPVNAEMYTNSNAFADGSVYLCGTFYTGIEKLSLDKDKRAELIQCIAKDVAAESLDGRYYPTSQEKCTLLIYQDDANDPLMEDRLDWRAIRIFVSQEYLNTLEFLQSNNLLPTSPSYPDAEWVKAVRYDDLVKYEQSKSTVKLTPVFQSFNENPDFLTNDLDISHLRCVTITDTDSIKSLQVHSYSQYNCADGGYVLYYKIKGKDVIVASFLPMKDAPDFIKQGVK